MCIFWKYACGIICLQLIICAFFMSFLDKISIFFQICSISQNWRIKKNIWCFISLTKKITLFSVWILLDGNQQIRLCLKMTFFVKTLQNDYSKINTILSSFINCTHSSFVFFEHLHHTFGSQVSSEHTFVWE